MFKKKQTCKLCGVKTTATDRCPKCGYSFRTCVQVSVPILEKTKQLIDTGYYGTLQNMSASYIKAEDIQAYNITVNQARDIFTKMGRL